MGHRGLLRADPDHRLSEEVRTGKVKLNLYIRNRNAVKQEMILLGGISMILILNSIKMLKKAFYSAEGALEFV